MQSPNYRWRCHRCQEANEAGTDRCHACGFPAVADGRLIESDDNKAEQKTSLLFDANHPVFLYFPEAILAALVAAYSPIWTVTLLLDGHFLPALLLFPVIAAACVAFYHYARQGRKWLAYTALIVILADAYGVLVLVNNAEREAKSCGQPAKTDKILSCTAKPKA